jgi:hypothetical protein
MQTPKEEIKIHGFLTLERPFSTSSKGDEMGNVNLEFESFNLLVKSYLDYRTFMCALKSTFVSAIIEIFLDFDFKNAVIIGLQIFPSKQFALPKILRFIALQICPSKQSAL